MALSCPSVLGEVLAHFLGYEAWPGGEITCVDGLAPGIYSGDESGHVPELYQSRQHVQVLHAVGKDVGLGGSVGCTVYCVNFWCYK